MISEYPERSPFSNYERRVGPTPAPVASPGEPGQQGQVPPGNEGRSTHQGDNGATGTWPEGVFSRRDPDPGAGNGTQEAGYQAQTQSVDSSDQPTSPPRVPEGPGAPVDLRFTGPFPEFTVQSPGLPQPSCEARLRPQSYLHQRGPFAACDDAGSALPEDARTRGRCRTAQARRHARPCENALEIFGCWRRKRSPAELGDLRSLGHLRGCEKRGGRATTGSLHQRPDRGLPAEQLWRSACVRSGNRPGCRAEGD